MTNLLNQLQQLSLQTSSSIHASPSVPMPSQPSSINIVQTSNPKGNKKFNRKKKGCGKKNQDGKGNANRPHIDVGESKKESKKKVKFPCKLCNGDHLTHLCPNILDAQCLLVQQGSSSPQAVLTNHSPQGKQLLACDNANTGTPTGKIRQIFI